MLIVGRQASANACRIYYQGIVSCGRWCDPVKTGQVVVGTLPFPDSLVYALQVCP